MDGRLGEFHDFPHRREEFVANRLREAILRGDLVPGERLDESALAVALGVSRTSIRSALRVLAAESLVELHPHRGAVVSELSPDFLVEQNLGLLWRSPMTCTSLTGAGSSSTDRPKSWRATSAFRSIISA